MTRRTVLMITNSELGQANVFISTADALLKRDPDVQIHIASFPRLEGTVKTALGNHGGGTAVKFHPLPGRPMFECLNSDKDPANNLFTASLLKPGIRNTPTSIKLITTRGFFCWEPEEYVDIFNVICELIKTTEPDVVLVDMAFSPGLTAGKHLKTRCKKPFTLTIMSPICLKDFIAHLEPRGAPFWKWPVVGSALPMPIPWWLIPVNIYLLIRLIIIMVTDPKLPAMTAKVRELTNIPDLDFTTILSMVHDSMTGIDKALVSARAEVDFPGLDYESIPKDYLGRIAACGPILRPLKEVDAELASWLRSGPVIYINLGTHCLTSESEAVDMARSLKAVIDRASQNQTKLQVLWKLQKDLGRSGDYNVGPGSSVHEVLGTEMDQGRVRIVSWVSSEPSSILHTGDVICSISHGGANSFYEALCAGVPQVVLPSWLDTYDFANRAELLGIGRWGSKKGCPRWITSELTEALVDVVLDRNAEYTAKSRYLAEICGGNGGGRATAAEELLKLLPQ